MPLATALFVLAATLSQPVVKTPLGVKIDDFMTRVERLGFSGALLVAKDGDVIVHKGYGKFSIDTLAPVGSITKQFTAAAILALEEEGKLRTTDPITKYFHDVPPDKQGITLHHLLTHSAGFPGAIGDDYDPVGRDAFIKLAMGTKLEFTPGTSYEYSNVGYSLLGAIIEIVTGHPYERYLHDRLFVRAGMLHTGYVIPKWDRTKLAHGFRGGEDEGTFLDRPWAPDGPYWHLRANGGIISTPADMYRWSLALDGDKVLSAASRKKLFTPYVREGNAPSSYAYGWAIYPLPNGHTIVMHNGGDGTFAADFRRYVDDGIVYYITSNVSERPSIAVSKWIGRLATGQGDVPMPPKVKTLTKEELHKFEGTRDGMRFTANANGSVTAEPLTAEAFARLAPSPGARAPMLAEATEHAKAVIDGIVARDYKPLQTAFGGGRSLEEITARQTRARQELESKYGALKGATIVGTRVERQDLATVVRLDFERGASYVVLMWGGPKNLVGLRLVDEMPGSVFYPVSATQLASYDFTTGETLTLDLP
ncbi:MAG: beta-lactamase family protein [Acidobacteria bacterium]|nr:beta-lactamase family protein [Acidobacteriota bacterium]MBV9477670.1 beta-lactamase family protein [Acidobacteriota bacterium]